MRTEPAETNLPPRQRVRETSGMPCLASLQSRPRFVFGPDQYKPGTAMAHPPGRTAGIAALDNLPTEVISQDLAGHPYPRPQRSMRSVPSGKATADFS